MEEGFCSAASFDVRKYYGLCGEEEDEEDGSWDGVVVEISFSWDSVCSPLV